MLQPAQKRIRDLRPVSPPFTGLRVACSLSRISIVFLLSSLLTASCLYRMHNRVRDGLRKLRVHSSTLTMIPKLSQFSSTFSTAPSHFTTFWREPHRQAAKDIRKRWRRCALWILLAAWLALLLFAFAVLIAPTSSVDSGSQPACLPDDSFALDPSKFRFFSKSGFFQITLGFGHMNFTEVKTIDIAWDIVS